MGDNTPTPGQNPGDANLNNNNAAGGQPGNQPGSGNDPVKNGQPGSSEQFDPSKISDQDFAKIFSDKRLWDHDRFKSLNDKAKKADEYEKAEAQRKQEELQKKGEWETIAKQKDEEIKGIKEKYQTAQINNQVIAEAIKLGVVDTEAVTKLVDRGLIKVDEDGNISGVAEAVKSLTDSKPYLIGQPMRPQMGGGTNPGNNNPSVPRFKASQLQDVKFYREHESEIMEAMRLGLIENDIPGQR